MEAEYPIGHRRRRAEGIPLLIRKFRDNLQNRFPAKRCDAIFGAFEDANRLEQMRVNEFVELFVE